MPEKIRRNRALISLSITSYQKKNAQTIFSSFLSTRKKKIIKIHKKSEKNTFQKSVQMFLYCYSSSPSKNQVKLAYLAWRRGGCRPRRVATALLQPSCPQAGWEGASQDKVMTTTTPAAAPVTVSPLTTSWARRFQHPRSHVLTIISNFSPIHEPLQSSHHRDLCTNTWSGT